MYLCMSFQNMAVRTADFVAVALIVLCGFTTAISNVDLAQLLRGQRPRQQLAQKRMMDGKL